MVTAVTDAPLAGWRVLVTRPAGFGDALAAQLAAAGAATALVPLLAIEPVAATPGQQALVADLDRFDIVIVTSRNAVAHGLPLLAGRWPQWPAGQAWLAIGRPTAEALAPWGIAATAPRDERSEGLLALPELAAVAGKRVLLLGGEGGRGMIARALAAAGAQLARLDVYRRVPAAGAAAALDTFGHNNGPSAVLVTSGEALHNLLALAPALAGGEAWLVVPGERVADAARAAGVRRLVVAPRADDTSMLAALLELATAHPREERP